MKIVVDENIPKRTVDALRADGHEVADLRGTDEQGSDDLAVWQRKREIDREPRLNRTFAAVKVAFETREWSPQGQTADSGEP